MYRSAAKRLLRQSSFLYGESPRPKIFTVVRALTTNSSLRFLSTVASESALPNQSPNGFESASSSYSESRDEDEFRRQTSRRTPPEARFEEEQARVLAASLRHVFRLGWSEAAMIAGAREVGVSPSIVGAFPRKEAALVEYFMDECLQRLIDKIDSDESLKDLLPSERVVKLVRFRLETQAPYISKWPQALSIQAQPLNFPTSFKQRAILVDEIWHGAGDEGNDVDWYVKRTVLGGIYSTTEIYMLTDSSPDFQDTWAFLNARVRDAFDLKNSMQEMKYLAEAVGAGMGSSFQGFMKRAC